MTAPSKAERDEKRDEARRLVGQVSSPTQMPSVWRDDRRRDLLDIIDDFADALNEADRRSHDTEQERLNALDQLEEMRLRWLSTARHAADEATEAEAALADADRRERAVRELHMVAVFQPFPSHPRREFCPACAHESGYPGRHATWPCPTIAALDGPAEPTGGGT